MHEAVTLKYAEGSVFFTKCNLWSACTMLTMEYDVRPLENCKTSYYVKPSHYLALDMKLLFKTMMVQLWVKFEFECVIEEEYFSKQDDVKVETLSNPSYDDATLELITHKSRNHKWVTEMREEF